VASDEPLGVLYASLKGSAISNIPIPFKIENGHAALNMIGMAVSLINSASQLFVQGRYFLCKRPF
jgi:hypothetical protein